MTLHRSGPLGIGASDDDTPGAPSVRLVDTATIAKMLGVSPRTVHDLTASGRLPSLKIGRRRLIDLRDLAAFVKAAKCGAEP